MRTRAAIAGVLGLAVFGAGCDSSPVQRREISNGAGNQGGAWEVVLPGGQAAADFSSGPELARRDESLNDRLCTCPLAEEDRPSLDGVRRITVRQRAGELIYFRSQRQYWEWGREPRR